MQVFLSSFAPALICFGFMAFYAYRALRKNPPLDKPVEIQVVTPKGEPAKMRVIDFARREVALRRQASKPHGKHPPKRHR